MCRLALFGDVQNFKLLARGLDQLEKSMGGDGNGFFSLNRGKILKGLDLTTGEIAFDAFDAEDTVMFHTRMATAGGKQDALAHPFDASRYVVMHNGHWSGWQWYTYGEESDTETAAMLVEDFGPGVLLNKGFDHSGMWCVMDKTTGHTLVIPRGSVSFVFQYLKGGGFFHASETIRGVVLTERMQVQTGQVYDVAPDGSVKLTELELVEMPEENWENWDWIEAERKKQAVRYSSYGNSYSKYSGQPYAGAGAFADDTYGYQNEVDEDNKRWYEKEYADEYGNTTGGALNGMKIVDPETGEDNTKLYVDMLQDMYDKGEADAFYIEQIAGNEYYDNTTGEYLGTILTDGSLIIDQEMFDNPVSLGNTTAGQLALEEAKAEAEEVAEEEDDLEEIEGIKKTPYNAE